MIRNLKKKTGQLLLTAIISLILLIINTEVSAQTVSLCTNTVTNGMFDQGTSGSTTIPGWTQSGPGKAWEKGTDPAIFNSRSGNDSPEKRTISQTVNDIALFNNNGTNYITVYFRFRVNAGSTKYFKNVVTFGGVKMLEISSNSTPSYTATVSNGALVEYEGNSEGIYAFSMKLSIPYTGSAPASGIIAFENETVNSSSSLQNVYIPRHNCTGTPMATQPTFDCATGKAFLLQNPNTYDSGVESNAILYSVDINTGAATTVSSDLLKSTVNEFSELNAMGYNPLDNYLWAYRSGTNQIVRIGSDNSVQSLTIPNLPRSDYNSGDIDANGIYYLFKNNITENGITSLIYRIDLKTGTLLPSITPSGEITAIDISVNPIDGNLYALQSNDGTTTRKLLRINQASGTVTTVANYPVSSLGTLGYGAAYFDESGNFFVSENRNPGPPVTGGRIFRFSQVHLATTPVLSFVSNGPITSSNDGARCPARSIADFLITGKVWNDVNGNAIQAALGEPGINTGTTNYNGLYAHLVDASNQIVATAPVKSDGTYEMATNTNGTYSVIIDKTEKAEGTTLIASAINSGWVHTGTNKYGTADLANNTGIISNIIVSSADVNNLDFGIQQPPTANSFTEPVQPNPGGITSVTVPSQGFGGTDFDGGTVVAIKIISFPTNATSITVGAHTYTATTFGNFATDYPTGISSPGGVFGETITVDPIDGAVTVSVPYNTVDNAGATSIVPGYVDVPFSTLLPVTLVSFTAEPEGDIAYLVWTTTEETNSDYFEVQYSQNSKNWVVLENLKASGTSKTHRNYNYTHSSPLSGTNYYRLKMVDRDGTFAYSRIQSIRLEQIEVSVYPNPVSEILYIKGINIGAIKDVVISNLDGKILYQSALSSKDGISVRSLAPGMYLFKILNVDGIQSVHKFLIIR